MASGNAQIGKSAPDFTATGQPVPQPGFVPPHMNADGTYMPAGFYPPPGPHPPMGYYPPGPYPPGPYPGPGGHTATVLVLFFYPLDFTFVCPTEIIAFSDHAEDFRKLGCEVLGVSVDSQFTHLAWINTPRKEGGLGPLNIPLLADVTKSLSQNYGVLKNDEGIAYRGLFIIDAKGVLRQITVNDLPVGRSVDEALRLVQAFQYTDEHGEVCPAGWKPGSDTIKPNVDDSKEYFSKHN